MALGEVFRLIRDPDVYAMFQAQPRATGGSGDHGAIHRHRFQNFQIRTGRDERGDDGEVRFDIQRAYIGDKFEQADAIVRG